MRQAAPLAMEEAFPRPIDSPVRKAPPLQRQRQASHSKASLLHPHVPRVLQMVPRVLQMVAMVLHRVPRVLQMVPRPLHMERGAA